MTLSPSPRRWTALLLSCSLAAVTAHAGTKGSSIEAPISPKQFSNENYRNNVSSDFRDSDRFQLDNPIKARIQVYGVNTPEEGYAELLFTYADQETPKLPDDLPRGVTINPYHRATLQTSDEFNRLQLSPRKFADGVYATVTGWPATPYQLPFSELLIDEIVFDADGEKLLFHAESDRLLKYEDRDKPKEETDEETKPAD